MKENDIFLDFEIINNYQSELKNNSIELENAINSTATNFVDLKNNNIYNNGFQQIENGLSRLKDTMNHCNKTLEKFKEKFLEYEKRKANEIDTIEIPKNFSVNDVMEINISAATTLNKKDGISVNNGTNQLENNQIKENIYQNVNAINIKDINNDNNLNAQELDARTNVKLQTIKSIDNENQLHNPKLDESTRIKQVAFENINNQKSLNDLTETKINFMENPKIENKKEIEGEI